MLACPCLNGLSVLDWRMSFLRPDLCPVDMNDSYGNMTMRPGKRVRRTNQNDGQRLARFSGSGTDANANSNLRHHILAPSVNPKQYYHSPMYGVLHFSFRSISLLTVALSIPCLPLPQGTGGVDPQPSSHHLPLGDIPLECCPLTGIQGSFAGPPRPFVSHLSGETSQSRKP